MMRIHSMKNKKKEVAKSSSEEGRSAENEGG